MSTEKPAVGGPACLVVLIAVGLSAPGCSGGSEADTAANGGASGGSTQDGSAGGGSTQDGAAGDGNTSAEAGVDASLEAFPGTDATDDSVGSTCGDEVCDANETCADCPTDCGACPGVCPNSACETGETCVTCPADCGVCQGVCPNGACETGETCATCPADCGACSEADPLFKCSFDTMQWWRGAGSRDITFVAIGDLHAADPTPGCPVNDAAGPNQNELVRAAINSAGAQPHVWPSGESFYREGQVYDHIRGVILAGDLTQAGSESIPAGAQTCREYTAYRDAFGRCGSEGKLLFPTYDVYGNHDFPRNPAPGNADYHPVVDYLDLITAAHRPGDASDLFDDPSAGTGHYAWRWDDIWFVNLDLKPGYNNELIEQTANNTVWIADPHHARGFLKEFLLSRTNSASRQIVVVAHYPANSSRIEDVEKESFCRLIHNAQRGTGDFEGHGQKLSMTYPIIAYLHGHTHSLPEHHDWTCPAPYDAITIPQFSVGTPLYAGANHPGQMHFTIIRIGTTMLEVVGASAPAADPTGSWTYVYKERRDYPVAP